MALAPGTRLGAYEILSLIGRGGMGEVYKARDTRLDRIVAIKVLPETLAADPQFRERFDREARTISQLTHPHICTLYDVGEQDNAAFLVMEYLDGETLAHRLTKGALPLDGALRIAIQIADAVSTAHRHGIVHRDLKPGNVMLMKSGAKLLDFGLAKASGSAIAGAGLSMLPTTPANLTAQGTILGTFQYMAPEQLQGQDADARTDIFAFGAVLYEMLTGKKAFEGKNQASLIGAILHVDPSPLFARQPLTPEALERLTRTCLAKDPDERWQNAGDLKRELKWIAESGRRAAVSGSSAARRVPSRVWATLFAIMVATTALAIAVLNKPARRELIQASILPAEGTTFNLRGDHPGPVSISPDGRYLVFTARRGYGAAVLWIRPLNSNDARALSGTEGAGYPFWSPDARNLGFFAAGKLKRISVDGGPPVTLCDAPFGKGGTWSQDGLILFAPSSHGPLLRVAASGGTPQLATRLEASSGEDSHRLPQFLPDGRHFLLFVRRTAGHDEASGSIQVGSLQHEDRKILLQSNTSAVYASGYLLFLRGATLMAQPFDAERAELTGEPVALAKAVRSIPTANLSIVSSSKNEVLVYQTGSPEEEQEIVWLDRAGKTLGKLGEPSTFDALTISPDGRRIAVAVADPRLKTGDIWLYDVRGGLPERFTFDAGSETAPIWSPDGGRIVFTSNRDGHYNLYSKPVQGTATEKLLLASDVEKYPMSWSHDGQFIAYVARAQTGREQTWLLPVVGTSKASAILNGDFDQTQPTFSPDGRWLAYESGETGRREVYVTSLPAGARRWQVSVEGGQSPRWRGDGRELFYLRPIGKLMAAELSFENANVRVLTAKPLFDLDAFTFDVTADGQRFLVIAPAGESKHSPITVVLNWTAALKK